MKKILLFLLTSLFAGSALAQYPLNWVNWDYINVASDVTRSVAYNPQTDHVLVATRMYGNNIFILDAATGDSLGKMSTEGLVTANSTYPLNMVAVAEDGTIFIANLAEQIYAPGSKFKIHRYENEQANPELVFEDMLDNGRYGDALAVSGSGNSKYLYSSGQTNGKMVVLRDDGGAQLVFDSYVTLPQTGNARHGISPILPGGKVWVNGADTGYPAPSLLAYDGTLITVAPDSILSAGGTSTVLHTKFGQTHVISALNAYHGTISSARYTEDELGTVTFGYLGDNYFSSPNDTLALAHKNGWMGNINATGTLSYDSRRHSLITLIGTNSIGSISMDKILKASTPRDSIWSVSIDGVNDFYPTDHVGLSNDRHMYFTWSSGKVFFGVTGHTLVDATENNRMYIVLDLDPQGENGSVVPPETAASVSSLPFKADAVIMVESWKEADFLIGTIYKWNGSAWIPNNFDGNIAAQGALAFAAEGNEKLAEVAAIRNDAGIGNTFTDINMMLYVAEKTSEGNVLSAFPGENPTGNGVQFSHYYYADSLGRGMFPTDQNYVKVVASPLSVERSDKGMPQDFALYENYPNPFNPQTKIRYFLRQPAEVKLKVYDLTGKLVQTLVDGKQRAGAYDVIFHALNLSTGVYFYQLSVNDQRIQTRKMVLIK